MDTHHIRFKCVFFFLAALVLFSGCMRNESALDITDRATEEELDLAYDQELKSADGYQLVGEGHSKQLLINASTAEITIKDKHSGSIWYSNPENRFEDGIAKGTYQNILESQLWITYSDSSDNFNNYFSGPDAVKYGQYTFSKIDNGVRVTYELGKKEKNFLAPKVMPPETMDRILSQLNEDDQLTLSDFYYYVDLDEIDDEFVKQQILELYPTLEENNLYVIANLSGEISDFVLESIQEVLQKTDYTFDEMKADYQTYGIKTAMGNPIFKVPVEYLIENDDFIARIPSDQIEFDKSKYHLTNLTVLPMFGAADQQKQGYIFVPDGSGALINLNNGKTTYESFTKEVYGRDRSIILNNVRTSLPDNGSQIYLPVFGLKESANSFLAIIEQGDAIAAINASVAGKNDMYNSVNASFLLTPYSQQIFSSLNVFSINNYQDKIYDGDIQIRYLFQKGEKADYVGMAQAYQNYLIEKGHITKHNINGMPIDISVVGAVDYNTTFLGFPRKGIKSLTTFDQAKMLLEKLKSQGVEDVNLRYLAWSNQGQKNTAFKNVELIGGMGGKKAFERLNQYAKENKINIYYDANFSYVTKKNFLHPFNVNKEGSKDLTGGKAYDYRYKLSNFELVQGGDNSYIVSPSAYSKFVQGFLKDLNKLDVTRVSLSSFGSDVNSDFDKKKLTNRQHASDLIEAQIEKIVSDNYKVSVQGANAYSIRKASFINGVPNKSGENYIFDETVPFYQIVIHGIVPFSSQPLNKSSDYHKDVLKLIETGTSPAFEWTFADNSELKDTEFKGYSTYYGPWIDDAIELYKKINEAVGHSANSMIASHRKLQQGVYRTEFANGNSVIVNYNPYEVQEDGLTIGAEDFQVVIMGDK